jgi:DNA-binding beta-propeller fold protein YncE
MNQIKFIKIYKVFKNEKSSLHKLITVTVFLLVLCFLGLECAAQSTPRRSLLALSKSNHTLAIVDPVTLQVISKIPVGPDPHEVIASADGKTAYVSNTGGGRSQEINVIDLINQKPLPNINTRPLTGPHGLIFAGGKLWFSAEGSKSVGRFDPVSGLIDWSMGTGQERTHMVYVSPDMKNIYTTNVNAATVSIIVDTILPPGPTPMGPMPPGAKPRQDWVQTVIPVAKGSEGFDVSPDGKELWTAGAEEGAISILNLGSKKVVGTIDAKIMGANRLKFTPDGKYVLVTSLRTGDLYIFDYSSRKEVKKLPIGHGAAGLLMDPDGTRVFAACTPDNYVVVIDLKSFEITGHIDVGGGPDGLAWAIRP